MKNAMLACAALLLAACATTSGPPAGGLARLEPVVPPDYDSERGIQWAASRADYAAARADARFVLRQFTYPSDGLTVGAYLYDQRAARSGTAPVIVFNRGSNGWAGRDELGGAELHDLMNIVPRLARIPGADASRLFLAGESRGGAMVYMALRDGFPTRAAAVWGAFTDLEELLAPGSPQAQYAPQIWPDIDTRREQIIATRSALRFAARIDVPVLIMHGGADQDIPPSQSRRMDAELTRLGKPHELIVYDGRQHVIGGRGAERDAAAVAWFRRFDPHR